MLRHTKGTLLFFVIALTLVFACTPALGQTVRLTEYSAKFLCGPENPAVANPFGLDTAVQPATYSTSINIHNPNATFGGVVGLPVVFVKKVVVSSPEGRPPNKPSPFRQDILDPDFSEEIDCTIIRSMIVPTPPPNIFIEGYFVIYALPSPVGPSELDVTEVVTATPELTRFGISTEIRTIAPRFIH